MAKRNRITLLLLATSCSLFGKIMRYLIIILTLFSLNANGQEKELIQKMIQGCLADSTFENNVFSDPDLNCLNISSFNIPTKPSTYYGSYNFSLSFKGRTLIQHDNSDSTMCSPIQISFFQKSNSFYEIAVSYSIFYPLSCEHLEGHGKDHGCFSQKIISLSRQIRVKKNGDLKIKKSNYSNRIMSGTFL